MQFCVKNAILSKTYCDEPGRVIPVDSTAVAWLQIFHSTRNWLYFHPLEGHSHSIV